MASHRSQAHAAPSSLQITLNGSLNMGVVLHESLTQRALHLTNEGPQPATFRLETDGSLPVRVSPAEGQLGARGSPDSSLQVSHAAGSADGCSLQRDPTSEQQMASATQRTSCPFLQSMLQLCAGDRGHHAGLWGMAPAHRQRQPVDAP